MALGGGVAGTGDGINGGTVILGTAKCAFTRRPVWPALLLT